MQNYIALIISFGVPLVAVVVVAVILLAIKAARRRFSQLLKLKLLSVRLPQKTDKKEKSEALAEINLTGQLLSGLATLKVPFSLEVAVHNVGEDIHFYLAVPEQAMDLAFYGLLPSRFHLWLLFRKCVPG
jgi:predicted TIM-barrel fold metal-dependent hydrolase